eukprot:5031023-Karenia_brevis.AAC.1
MLFHLASSSLTCIANPGVRWFLSGDDGVEDTTFWDEAQAHLISMSSCVWQHTRKFRDVSMQLLRLPVLPAAAAERVIEQFFDQQVCCLDELVGEVLRESCTRQSVQEDSFKQLCIFLLKKIKGTNMSLESELSELR